MPSTPTQLTSDDLRALSIRLGQLKKALVRRFTNEFSDLSTGSIRRAVDEADALAQSTGFPHLVLPLLAEESVRHISELSFSSEPAGDAALAVAGSASPRRKLNLNQPTRVQAITRHFIAASALFFTLGAAVHADQPSIDRLALDAGVVAWVSAWNPGDKPFDSRKLERLYHRNVITRAGERTVTSWKEYLSTLQPCIQQFVEMTSKPADKLKVELVEDGRAETSFVIHPLGKRRDGTAVSATTHVRLVWAKADGLWQIAEQEIAWAKDAETPAVVAR